MSAAPRTKPSFLTVVVVTALISLAMTLLTPMREGQVDWSVIGVPLGLLIGVAASALGNRHGKARVVLSLIALSLFLSSALLIVQRLAH
jgi:hypothetical protein